MTMRNFLPRYSRLITLLLMLTFGFSTVRSMQSQDPSPVSNQVNTRQLNVYLLNPPVPVNGIQAGTTGTTGATTYCYWIVVQYTIGPTSPGGPACVNNANSTLSGSNFVAISWPFTLGGTIDILRTTSTTPPQGNCACAVATGIAAGTISQNDTSNTLGAYTVAAAFNPNNAVLSLQNVPISAGVSHLEILNSTQGLVLDLQNPSPITQTGSNGYVSTIGIATTGIVTLNTGSTTTTTAAVIPPNSIIVGGGCKVTTNITTAVNWSLSATFNNSNIILSSTNLLTTAPTTFFFGSFGSGTPGVVATQSDTADTFTFTTNANPGAGAIRCSFTYISSSGPTS
jgi:hypothetical protein